MKTFTIYPDKARALGNVMTNNSNVEDMVEVNSSLRPLVGETVEYDNLPFPIFEMGVEQTLYGTSLTLSLSSNSCYVGDTVTVTATLRDNNNELLDGSIAFKCGNDCITNGNNTGEDIVYANTVNGSVSFTYSFDSMGEYTIQAYSAETNMHHKAEDTGNVVVSKKDIQVNVEGIYDTSTYRQDIPFVVELIHNGQCVAGLEYSLFLDGELFDTGISTISGEEYIINNIEPGTHIFSINYSGNNMYESASESISFYDSKLPDVNLRWTITNKNTTNRTATVNLIVEVSSENNPVENMPLSIRFGGLATLPDQYTNYLGRVTLPLTSVPYGSHNVTINTSALGEFSATELTRNVTIS